MFVHFWFCFFFYSRPSIIFPTGFLDFVLGDSIKIKVIVCSGPPRSRCQDGVRCAREGNSCEGQRKGEQEKAERAFRWKQRSDSRGRRGVGRLGGKRLRLQRGSQRGSAKPMGSPRAKLATEGVSCFLGTEHICIFIMLSH